MINMRNLLILKIAIIDTRKENVCSAPGRSYYPHPDQCEKFFQCSLGVPFEKSCPLGTYWSVGSNSCDWPHKTNCTKGIILNKQ